MTSLSLRATFLPTGRRASLTASTNSMDALDGCLKLVEQVHGVCVGAY